MKVCFVNLRALPALSEEHKKHRIGGAEVQVAQLAAAFSRRGLDVRLVVGDFGQQDGAVYSGVRTFASFEESEGLPVFRFVYPRWTKLWAAFERADADVYYVACAGMALGMLAMFCRLHRRRLVFHAASDSDCVPEKLLIRYRRDRWLYEYGLRRADAILVQSATQQQDMESNYGRASTIVRMLVERPLDGALRLPKDVDVLWVANLRQLKRPDRLLELARRLPGRRFHMAGGAMPGEDELYRRIEADARTIPNLTFHGQIPYIDVGRLFDRARLFVNTSDVEGFPNTFLQAWVRGVPVVTMFDPDGVVARARLGSSHAALGEMVEGVEALLGSDAKYGAASSAALAYMQQAFDEDTVLAPYLQVFLGAQAGTAAPVD